MNERPTGLIDGGSVYTGPPPAITAEKLSKTYGYVKACDEVDIELFRGEIHGILGENGAGKSTLMKMLIGLVLPDGGGIKVDGKSVTIRDPLDASALGIGMVHQHFSLVEALTVWENVALGDNNKLDRNETRERVADLSLQYGLDVNPDDRVEDLPVGMRQRVELLKCLRKDPSVLILDEPTSALGQKQQMEVLKTIKKVQQLGNIAIILITHNEIHARLIADRYTFISLGEVIGSGTSKDLEGDDIRRLMAGGAEVGDLAKELA